ncbi:hypothetical protein TeGR_g3874, partial [Tetraparma gracilis]
MPVAWSNSTAREAADSEDPSSSTTRGAEPTSTSGTGRLRVPTLKTTRLAIEAAAEAASEATSTFSVLVRAFILESFLLSALASVLPVVVLLAMTRPWVEAVALQYYGDEGSTPAHALPCYMKLLNVTVAPIKGHYSARYFLPPPGPAFVSHLLEVSQVGFVSAATVFAKAMLMFRPGPGGMAAAFVLAAGSFAGITHFYVAKRELDHIAGEPTSAASMQELYTTLVFVLAVPTVGVVAAASAGSRSARQLAAVFALFLGSNFVEFVFYEVFSGALLPFFFAEDTTALGHFLARGPVLFSLFTALMETMWQLSILAVRHLAVAPRDSHILLTSCVVVVPLFARLMQGSAQSAGSSAFFEAISTGCEIVAVHSLLKGRTP